MSLPALKLVYADGSDVLDANFQNGSLVKIVGNNSPVPFDNASYYIRITDGSFNYYYLRSVNIPSGASESELFDLTVSQELPLNAYSQAVLDTNLTYYARILNLSQADALGVVFSNRSILPASPPQVAIQYEGVDYVVGSGVLTSVQAGNQITFVSTLGDGVGYGVAVLNADINNITGILYSCDGFVSLGAMVLQAGTSLTIDPALGGLSGITFGVSPDADFFGTPIQFNTWIQTVEVIAVSPPAEPQYSLAGQTAVAIETLNAQVASLEATTTTLSETVVSVEALAGQALEAAGSAQTAADAAQSAANQALIDASAAQSAANQAQLDATQALADANTAIVAANAAQDTANQAVSDAAAAQATADNALVVGENRSSSKISIVGNAVIALPVVDPSPEKDAVDLWRNAELSSPGVGPSSLLIATAALNGEEVVIPYSSDAWAATGAVYRVYCPLSSAHGVNIRFQGATSAEDFVAGVAKGSSVGIIRIAGGFLQPDGF